MKVQNAETGETIDVPAEKMPPPNPGDTRPVHVQSGAIMLDREDFQRCKEAAAAPADPPAVPQQAAPPMPTVGRIVHYVMPSGAVRPAIVVQASIPCSPVIAELHVFRSKQDPTIGSPTGVAWEPDGKFPGTWHWPKRS